MSAASNYRLTIQMDLSGFSFIVYDRNGAIVYRSDGSDADSSYLDVPYHSVEVYYPTLCYTMIPVDFYSHETAYSYLESVRELPADAQVCALEIPGQKMFLVYAIGSDNLPEPLLKSARIKRYPLVYSLIDSIQTIEGNNKIILARSEEIVHIVAAERGRFLFANSFPAEDDITALYFITSVAHQVMFNPELTSVYIKGTVTDAFCSTLENYFNKVGFVK